MMPVNSSYYDRISFISSILQVSIRGINKYSEVNFYKYKYKQFAIPDDDISKIEITLGINGKYLNLGELPIFLFDAPHKLEALLEKNFDYLYDEESMVEYSHYAGLLKVMQVIGKNINTMNTVLKVDLRELRKQKEFPNDVLDRCEDLLGINPQYIRNGFGEMFTPDAREKLWHIFKEDFKDSVLNKKQPEPAQPKAKNKDILALRKKVLTFVPLTNYKTDELKAILNNRNEIEQKILDDIKAYFDLLNIQVNNDIF